MIKKIITLNIKDTPNELLLRKDIEGACEDKYSVIFANSNDWWIQVNTNDVKIMSPDGEVNIKDSFVFIRVRGKDSAFVALISHILKLSGVDFTDSGNEYHSDFTDKAFAIPRIAFHGFPVPDTIVVSLKSLIQNIKSIESGFEYPCVVKGDGARGDNVVVVRNRMELLDFAENGNKKPSLITIQKIIDNTYDVRVLFINEEFLGAVRRTRSDKEPFLNNVSTGADVAVDTLTKAEEDMCREVMKISYLTLCGIDFIRTPNGIVFLELNKSPQLGGVRSVIPDLSVGKGLRSLIDKIRR